MLIDSLVPGDGPGTRHEMTVFDELTHFSGSHCTPVS